MRNANLLNDFAFKYVFGEDCKEANDALKSLITVFLERSVNKVVVKNSEIVKDYSKMKSPRLDLLVEFDDQTTVDLEMQLRQTKDNLPIRFSYYLARLHGCQKLEGKYYGELMETIVLVFFNVNLIDNHRMCNTFTLRNEEGLSFVEESQDRMKLRTVEMAKLDLNKPLKDMNEQEKMIYYFLNCHKGMDDSKIKVMIESDGVIQMLEKRVETISDDGWKKIIEDFQKLHENEERMERQLEIEELQRAKEEARKAMLEVNKLKQEANKLSQEADKKIEDAEKKSEEADKKFEEADKKFEEANKQIEQANKQIEDANTRVNDANKRADESAKKMNQMNQEMKQMNQEMKQMIQGMLSNGMSLEFVSKLLSKSESEIMELVK